MSRFGEELSHQRDLHDPHFNPFDDYVSNLVDQWNRGGYEPEDVVAEMVRKAGSLPLDALRQLQEATLSHELLNRTVSQVATERLVNLGQMGLGLRFN